MTEHWWPRRTTQRTTTPGARPDRAVGAALRSARQAREDSARKEAQQQLVELGQLLEHSAAPLTDVQQSLLTRGLDAYDAAARVLDHARDIADIAGVLVLVRIGHAAAVAAGAGAADTGAAQPRSPLDLCFFNPLHGTSARHVRWRALGQREALVVRACADCADRVHQRRQPDALTCLLDGREVPYYEVDPRQSVWAATGYGQFTADLIERVLTGFPAG